MPRKPNYRFERHERDKAKAAKKAAKREAKAEKKTDALATSEPDESQPATEDTAEA